MITIETVRNKYAGDDASYVFPYTFRVDDSSHLKVYHVDSAGTVTLYTVGVEYTVDGIGAATGGDIELQVGYKPLASGESLVLVRDQPNVQSTDFRSTGRANLETMELSLDRLTQYVQELQDQANRCLELGATDTDGSGTYDANGNAIDGVAVGTSSTSLVTRGYVDLPIYTSQAAADAAMGTGALALHKGCIVRIAGMPEQFQLVMLKADGVTKVLTTVAMAPLV